MSSMAPRVIAIEGNIGAGKSTLLEALRGQGYTVVPEPLGAWLNCEGTNLLGAYYEKPKRWSLTFQMWCLLTRAKALERALESASGHKGGFVFVERSLLSDLHVFSQHAVAKGNMSLCECTANAQC